MSSVATRDNPAVRVDDERVLELIEENGADPTSEINAAIAAHAAAADPHPTYDTAAEVAAAIAAIPTGFTNPMTTAGDMLYEGGGVDQVLGNASYTGSSGNGALATDGDDATSFHPANGDNASWRAYDLGSAKTIASWRIKQSSATATKIQTSADGSTGWTDQATYSGLDSGPTNFGSPVTARYWRFLLSGFYDIYTFSLTDAVVPARLAKGTAGQVMTQGAAAPSWQSNAKLAYLDAPSGTAPANPAAGTYRLYAKSDGVYYRDSAGVEKGPLGAGASSGGGWPPYFDYAASLRLIPLNLSSSQYWGANPGGATDGDPATNANAQSATMPQDFEVDLGGSAPAIGTVHVVYADSSHRSASGSLDWSDDGTTWTQAVTWSADATTDRWHTLSPALSHPHWRIHTTAPGSGGSGINVSQFQMFTPGVDRARGITPTSNNSYVNIANATDAYFASKATATSASFPALFAVDLGAAYAIIAVHTMYGDSGHAPLGGKIQYSTDNSTWTDAVGISVANAVDRWNVFAAPITARYWRVTTSTISNNAGLDVAAFEVISAT